MLLGALALALAHALDAMLDALKAYWGIRSNPLLRQFAN